jgi:hypothetical protein
MKVIWVSGKQKYFFKRGWTGTPGKQWTDLPVGLFGWSRQQNFLSVIPGHREAMSPESITPIRGYGFRACAKRRIPE